MSASHAAPAQEQRAQWAEIEKLLRIARAHLGGPTSPSPVPDGALSGTLNEFEEFLDHNELELAWDALASLAERNSAPSECWRLLAHAASSMKLRNKQEMAARRMNLTVTPEQALAIARKDGEAKYRDLSFYRVVLALEPDGWHVDYELPTPNLNGGGPHYVIDASNGAIVQKRYEQ